jgi:hypothetical protein
MLILGTFLFVMFRADVRSGRNSDNGSGLDAAHGGLGRVT